MELLKHLQGKQLLSGKNSISKKLDGAGCDGTLSTQGAEKGQPPLPGKLEEEGRRGVEKQSTIEATVSQADWGRGYAQDTSQGVCQKPLTRTLGMASPEVAGVSC